MMCQCRLIECHKGTTLVEEVISGGGGCACLGAGGKWERSVLCTQFFYEPKIALKINSIKNTFGINISNFPLDSKVYRGA